MTIILINDHKDTDFDSSTKIIIATFIINN